MLTVLRKKKTMKRIMWVLASIIVFTFAFWNATRGTRGNEQQRYAGKIFGQNVSHEEFLKNLASVQHQALLDENYSPYIDFENWAWERLILLYEAKRKKVSVANQEVVDRILAIPFFRQDGKFDQKKYTHIVTQSLRTTPQEFEKEIMGSLKIEKLIDEVAKDVQISEAQLLQEHKKENDKVSVDYLLIAPADFAETISLEDKEIQDYYNEHKQNFKRGQTVKVNYLAATFKKIREKITPDAKKIELYYARAKETSPPEERKEKFEMLTDEQKKSFEEKWLIRETQNQAEDKIWEVYEELKKNPGDLSTPADKYDLEQGQTEFFARNEIIPNIGWSADFTQTAFSLKPGEFSSPLQTQNGYFIISLKEKLPPHIPEIAAVQEAIKLILKKEKALNLAMQKAQGYLKTIKEENLSLQKFAAGNNLTVRDSGFFSRADYIPGLAHAPEFTTIAFSLGIGEIGGIAKTLKGYCIIQLKEKQPTEEKKFTEEKTQFKEKVLARKKQQAVKVWLDRLLVEANPLSYLAPEQQ